MRTPQNVYRRCVEFEEKAAAIYLRLAARFSPENMELSSLWLEMGMQEKEHAGLLQFCLAEKLFAPDIVRNGCIRKLSTLFRNLERRAANPNLDINEAFLIAEEMESSEANEIYSHLTSPLHKSMYLVRKKIASSLPDHIGLLAHAARKFGADRKTIRKLERIASKQIAA